MWLSYNSADYLYKSIYPRHGAEAPVRNGASGSYLARATSRKTRILVGITWQAIGWLSNRKLGSVNGASLDMRFTTLGPFGTAGGESAEAVRAFSPASAGRAAGRAFLFAGGASAPCEPPWYGGTGCGSGAWRFLEALHGSFSPLMTARRHRP